jgi:DedD protein
MGLLSIFKRRPDSPTGAATTAEPGDPVQRARTRARQRLIGAVVLVGVGIVGFPLVFETQPRPIPVDIPIEVPRKDGAPTLVVPAPRTPVPDASASAVHSLPSVSPLTGVSPNEVTTEGSQDAGSDGAAPQPATRAGLKNGEKPSPALEPSKPATEPKPAKTAQESKPKSIAEAKPAPAPAAESARAKSLLEGKQVAAADSGRFVLQVGAFSDEAAAHAARVKVEKLGLKAFTQLVNTAGGSRIRVRVGPFATRDEADTALAKARSAGLSAVVLPL